MAHCSSCSAQILWVKMVTRGGAAPLDATPTKTGNIRLLGNRRAVAKVLDKRELEDARTKGELLYTSHFATCPEAKAHRKTALSPSAAAPQPPLSRAEHSASSTAGARSPSRRPTVRP